MQHSSLHKTVWTNCREKNVSISIDLNLQLIRKRLDQLQQHCEFQPYQQVLLPKLSVLLIVDNLKLSTNDIITFWQQPQRRQIKCQTYCIRFWTKQSALLKGWEYQIKTGNKQSSLHKTIWSNCREKSIYQ